tara:strand:- start:3084 stop:3626 length:543 start_codon:yes stop_codon:yes gene_type:complete
MKAIFLDRDGIININRPYINRINKINFVPGLFEALKILNKNGFSLIIITNQGGVGLGKISESEYFAIQDYVEKKLLLEGIRILKTYYSFFHPKNPDLYKNHRLYRKPESGMIEKSILDFGIKREKSFLIGDKMSDIESGRNSNITSLLIRNEYSDQDANSGLYNLSFKDISSAVSYIIES